MKKLLASLFVAGVLATGSMAENATSETWPADFSACDYWYRPADVAGIRIGIPWGLNDSITGIDIGLWGKSRYAWAFQINLTRNIVEDQMGGLQISLLNEAGSLIGMQIGLWNQAPTMKGFQIGILNLADEVNGMQIGLVNRTENMTGYQIGLVNVIRESSVPFAPIINFKY